MLATNSCAENDIGYFGTPSNLGNRVLRIALAEMPVANIPCAVQGSLSVGQEEEELAVKVYG